MKIALGQIEVIAGRPDLNTQAMVAMIEQARSEQADLIVFPEMAVPGYLLGDLWEQEAFLRDCETFGRQIVAHSTNLCIMFGNIAVDWTKRNNDGRVRKYNAFFTAYNGSLLGNENFPYPYRIKTLQPNYRAFDDNRHFYSLEQLAAELHIDTAQLLQPVQVPLPAKLLNVGCILCEDGWADEYAINPVAVLTADNRTELIVNISSSPFTLGKNSKRHRVFAKQALQAQRPLVYVNATGLQNNGKTIYTFDGCSTVYDNSGCLIGGCDQFVQQLSYVELSPVKQQPDLKVQPTDQNIAAIYQAVSYGVDRFTRLLGIKKVVVGVSGGIDSAVAAALYVKVLGRENVLLVNMPSTYNSQTTRNLAYRLAENLQCLYTVMPIQQSVDETIAQLQESAVKNLATGQQFYLSVSSFTAENIQARDRSARILAGIAAAFGGVFTCNANKSELTIGYSTLYGDQAGFLAALADLWKHQVYELACYINQTIYGCTVIPQESIDIVPSAELSFDQAVDQGKGDPLHYPYHDYLFRAFVEHWNRATPEDILQWYSQGQLEQQLGCQAGLVGRLFATPAQFISDLEQWWKLYTGMAVAKRIQAPPIIAVSRRAFGFDHREAQNGCYFTARYHKLKQQLLSQS